VNGRAVENPVAIRVRIAVVCPELRLFDVAQAVTVRVHVPQGVLIRG
jgi:hypothetical protein